MFMESPFTISIGHGIAAPTAFLVSITLLASTVPCK
jgi:hypothetical protein